ncbi:MAG: oxygen-independent coproporphyrinogen III oxidase [Pseudomonadota bacterium]
MWPYHPDLLDTPVPRYTSYPTAADFGSIEPGDLRRSIEQASGDISLYLHIPFCEKICFYCGCNTGASGRRARLESYLQALHTEIETVSALLPLDAKVRRIAFGGGSPNAIEPEEFIELVDAIHRNFRLNETEWSIELDPRTMTSVWGEAIAEAGVTRASMGVQTFAHHCQLAIGREQSDALICRSIDWLRGAGVTSLNFDLMYGLPDQSLEDLSDSLEYTKLLGADRVALFGYAHVPHIVKRQKMIDASALPGKEARFEMAEFGYRYFTNEGYVPVGFDHFALPQDPLALAAGQGTLGRNFQGFTDDPSGTVIGLGSSAISAFPELLAQNEKNSGRYRMISSQGQLSANHGKKRSPEDRLRGEVIQALLCKNQATLTPCLLHTSVAGLRPFLDRGLTSLNGLNLAITAAGLHYARAIAAQFDPYRAKTQRQFSSAI